MTSFARADQSEVRRAYLRRLAQLGVFGVRGSDNDRHHLREEFLSAGTPVSGIHRYAMTVGDMQGIQIPEPPDH